MSQTQAVARAARSRAGTATIPVRKPEIDFTGVRLYFYDDNPLGSSFWAVLQALFPDGERFFIKAVHDCRERVEDPVLQGEIDAFMGQEAAHGRVHREVNERAQQVHGIDLKTIERRTGRIMGLFNRFLSPMQRLAMTAGAEHFTATVARFLLRHPEYMAGFRDAPARQLVMWHALEEREHRAVAFDVYQGAGGGYLLRAVMLLWMGAVLAPWVTYEVVRMNVRLGGHRDRAAMRRGLRSLFGRNGILRRILPGMRDYFRRDFHPSDDDQSELEAEWLRELGYA